MNIQQHISTNTTYKALLATLLLLLSPSTQAAKPKDTQSPQIKTTQNKAALPDDDSSSSEQSDNDDEKEAPKSYARITPKLLNFNKCDQSTKQTVSTCSDAQDWQELQPGLNLIGLCTTPKCKAGKDIVASPQGFATFNIAKVTSKATCPACQSTKYRLKNVQTCAFYLCNYTIEGEYQDKDGSIESMKVSDKHTNYNDFHTFIGGQENNRQYLWLEIIVTKL